MQKGGKLISCPHSFPIERHYKEVVKLEAKPVQQTGLPDHLIALEGFLVSDAFFLWFQGGPCSLRTLYSDGCTGMHQEGLECPYAQPACG